MSNRELDCGMLALLYIKKGIFGLEAFPNNINNVIGSPAAPAELKYRASALSFTLGQHGNQATSCGLCLFYIGLYYK